MKHTAEFIEQACNSHDEMLAALKDMIYATKVGTFKDLHPHLYRRIKKAIAKAEE